MCLLLALLLALSTRTKFSVYLEGMFTSRICPLKNSTGISLFEMPHLFFSFTAIASRYYSYS
jgi:hypothetical protein